MRKPQKQQESYFVDYIITTCCCGAGSTRITNWSSSIDIDIIICIDNDAGGDKYTRVIYDILLCHSVNSTQDLNVKKLERFKIIKNTPQARDGKAPDKYDLTDCLADGWTSKIIKRYQEHKDFTTLVEEIEV